MKFRPSELRLTAVTKTVEVKFDAQNINKPISAFPSGALVLLSKERVKQLCLALKPYFDLLNSPTPKLGSPR
jgi:hypothetical protein